MQSAKCKVQIKAPAPGTARVLRLGFALCTLHFVLSACSHTVSEFHGAKSPTPVEVSGNRLSANLFRPPSPPAAIRAAAEQTLRARGYVITEAYGTTDKIHLEASGTGERRTDKTTIEAWSDQGLPPHNLPMTRLTVDSGLFGDTAAARAILDDILARLGR